MTRAALMATAAMAVVFVVACQQETPTGVAPQITSAPVTVDLEIPWSDFASNLAVYGGYGVPSELGVGFVANDFEGTLDARTLVRFGDYPTQATVRDSTGASRPDSALVYISGRMVAYFDTVASTNSGPVTLALGATIAPWDRTTVTWTAAVDTINDLRLWTEAGAGPVMDLNTSVWDPATGDSAVFELDSAQVAAWAETTDPSVGARVDLVTAGVRLRMSAAALRLDARPSSNPDTVITVSSGTPALTFIYDPLPAPPPDGIRIGGAPSWRTILDVSLPDLLDGLPELCSVIACPHSLDPGEISYAALVLTSRPSEAAFQPTDSVGLDVRPVLRRDALPKAPLGTSLIGDFFGRRVAAEAFGSAPGERIEIPITVFTRALLGGIDAAGRPSPNTLALLSVFEPVSIAFASFHGPGTPDEPRLRLVLTIGPPVELP